MLGSVVLLILREKKVQLEKNWKVWFMKLNREVLHICVVYLIYYFLFFSNK